MRPFLLILYDVLFPSARGDEESGSLRCIYIFSFKMYVHVEILLSETMGKSDHTKTKKESKHHFVETLVLGIL